MGSNRTNIFTFSFYNVENLFDTLDDPYTFDDDYTPLSKRSWNLYRYKKKIRKLSSVISQLGRDKSINAPVVVGLVEVENNTVLKDLINHRNLLHLNYSYIHFDSPDERGIDTALLYDSNRFEVVSSKTFPLVLYKDDGTKDYTRDVLLVSGYFESELIHIIVNHWPSRREGITKTEPQRIKAAELVRKIIEEVKFYDFNPKIIIMGDFNDNPNSLSVKEYLLSDDLYNPMESIYASGVGSISFQQQWNLFDQIIITRNFFDTSNSLTFLSAEVFDREWLKVRRGKLKGTPFRTYIGPWYKGGFSDHFPVNVFFELDK